MKQNAIFKESVGSHFGDATHNNNIRKSYRLILKTCCGLVVLDFVEQDSSVNFVASFMCPVMNTDIVHDICPIDFCIV